MSEGGDWRKGQQALHPRITADEWRCVQQDELWNTQVTLGLLLVNELREVLEELGRLRGDVQELREAVRGR